MRKIIIGLLLVGLLVTPVNALVIRSGGERNLGGADGFVGWSTYNSDFPSNTGKFTYSVYTPDKSGTVGYAKIIPQFNLTNQEINIAIFSSSGVKLAEAYSASASALAGEWLVLPLNQTVDVGTSSEYICGFIKGDYIRFKLDTVNSGVATKEVNMTLDNSLENFDPATATTRYANYRLVIVFDNVNGDPE